MAKALGSLVNPQKASEGQVAGTWDYMSPEQTTGDEKRIDVRSDAYVLGAILYQLMTDRLPINLHGCPTVAAAIDRIRTAVPIPPRKLNPQIDVETGRGHCQGVKKDPEQRYDSVRALRNDLNRWIAGDPVEADGGAPAWTSVLRRVCRWTVRRPLAAALWVVALAVCIARWDWRRCCSVGQTWRRCSKGLARPRRRGSHGPLQGACDRRSMTGRTMPGMRGQSGLARLTRTNCLRSVRCTPR